MILLSVVHKFEIKINFTVDKTRTSQFMSITVDMDNFILSSFVDDVSKISKKRYSQNAFRFCNRAYNLIFHNYRSCQFTAHDHTLTRLITVFPKMMNFVGIMKEQQDKAIMNLLVSSDCSSVRASTTVYESHLALAELLHPAEICDGNLFLSRNPCSRL